MNIFIIGKLTSAYRSEAYVRSFLELGYKNIYINNYKGHTFFRNLTNILMLIFSDVVFIPPLQHSNRLIKLAIFLKKKIMLDFYVSYYDSNVFDYKLVDENSKEAKKLLDTDRTALTESSFSTFLNKSERELYLNRVGLKQDEINSSIIPLCIPEKKSFAHLEFFSDNRKTMNICWVGTYIPLHGLDVVIHAMSLVKKAGYNVQLYLWGNSNGAAQPYIDRVAKENLTDVVTFINNYWGDMETWEDFIVKNCDVSLGVFGESKKAQTVLPNKVVDGITFKTPVITQYSKGVSEYFDYTHDIFGCENNPESLAGKIIEVYHTDWIEIQKRLNDSYEIYEKNFSYHAFKLKVKKSMDRLMEM